MLLEMFMNHKKSLVHKFEHHIRIYEELFEPFRGKPVSVLELGVAQGGSLQLWREYFGPEAKILGVDIQGSYHHLKQDNIEVIFANEADPDLPSKVTAKIGEIDILIDDAGHECLDQIAAFENFFPYISDGGIYACEDIHTSYRWTHHGGLKSKYSFVEYMKEMADYMHIAEFRKQLPEGFKAPASLDHIKSITFHRSLLVVRKALDANNIGSPLMREG